MCGIAAILLFPQMRSAEQWQAIKDAFTQNLIFNEDRGKYATGMVVIDINGAAELHKSPLAASKFVNTAGYQNLLSKIGSKTTLILGHTRMPTKGDRFKNRNNQPVQSGTVFGVHNGQIENDDELFIRFGIERTTEVDSEIIFRLIESVDPSERNGQYLGRIHRLIQVMEGQYTFLACDQRRPEQLLVLKHNNPLSIHFHRQWNALVFSSRYVYLRKAFGASQVAEVLEHDQLTVFDALRLPELEISPKQALPFYLV